MSGHWPPRFPQNQRGSFSGGSPRFPPLNPPPQHGLYRGFQTRNPHFQNVQNRGCFQPRFERHPSPYRNNRPNYEGRGRSRGSRGNHGNGRFNKEQGIEAFYKHSMVEDPWKDLQGVRKQDNQQAGAC